MRVVLHGDSYDEAAAEAMRLVAEEGRVLIHAYRARAHTHTHTHTHREREKRERRTHTHTANPH